uniref:Uncharacterized protein n=1 Tax=Ficedula albicollis TaxID=59894 RepID=A0A803WAH7_FICAL
MEQTRGAGMEQTRGTRGTGPVQPTGSAAAAKGPRQHHPEVLGAPGLSRGSSPGEIQGSASSRSSHRPSQAPRAGSTSEHPPAGVCAQGSVSQPANATVLPSPSAKQLQRCL